MRKHLLALLPAIALLGLSAPANALVMVIGNQLAHDCYEMAKAGTDPVNGIEASEVSPIPVTVELEIVADDGVYWLKPLMKTPADW